MGHIWGTAATPSAIGRASERDLDAIPVTCAAAGGYSRQTEETMICKAVADCHPPSLAPFIEWAVPINAVMNPTARGSLPG